MKFLKQTLQRLASPRGLVALLITTLMALLPTAAHASEGENVVLNWSQSDKTWLIISFALGVIALIYGLVILRNWVMSQSPGDEKMQEVGLAIKEGALAYLRQQIRTMLIFVVVLFAGLVGLYWRLGPPTAFGVGVCFLAGVTASYVAGYAGMLMAVNGNMRVANAALTSYKRSLETAFRSGAVAGMVTVGVGLTGASTILFFFPAIATTLLVGFGFGGSLAALFMRVGGGIFTKAADVGADLVGKVEAGIPEDDPRNPATIADNVGDNVGDCAGMAADVFESYEVTLVAAIVLGAATAAVFDQETWTRLIVFALIARGVGVIASIIGIASVKGNDDLDKDPLRAIRKGFYSSAGIALLATFIVAYFLMGGSSKMINTTQLIGIEKIQHDKVVAVLGARDGIAAKDKSEAKKVTAEQILASPEGKALGLTDSDKDFVTGAIKLQKAPAINEEKYQGYVPAKSQDTTQVALDYAISTTSSVNKFFSGTGDDEVIVAKVHQVTDMPETPASGQIPAQAAQHIDRSIWLGPTTKKQLDQLIKQQNDTFAAQKVKGSFTLEDSVKPSLYVSNDGKSLVVAVPDKVSSFEGVRGIQYVASSPEAVNADIRAGKQPEAQLTPVVVETHHTVEWWKFAVAIGFGILMAFAIEALTDYYVSTHKKPTQEVASVSSTGAATMIIQGFAYACESSVFMVFAIVVALMFPIFLFNPAEYGGYILSFYGIALVGLGLLTTTGYVLAMDTFGPISDNAQGIYEMSGVGDDNEYGSKAVQRLDAAGNTTKALTKGFAIATAVVAAVALFHSYLEGAKLGEIGLRLDVPEIFLGLLVGGAAPFLFSASTINAVGRSAFQLINEVRRQFREDAGIMAGTSKPDYGRCVAIVTAAAQKELLGPGILAIGLPVAVGFGFSIGKNPVLIDGQYYNLTGAQALGGFLAGTILSGQLMAVLLANSGGMWDNAKKLIEDGLYGGKGSDAHKAAVICDTVGDPFKDTAGPALNPLIKVMNLVALLLSGVIILPLSNGVLSLITLTAVGALAISIYVSKKDSMSTKMAAVSAEAKALDEAQEAAPAKKRITVENNEEEK